jgi:hypothetical protein
MTLKPLATQLTFTEKVLGREEVLCVKGRNLGHSVGRFDKTITVRECSTPLKLFCLPVYRWSELSRAALYRYLSGARGVLT